MAKEYIDKEQYCAEKCHCNRVNCDKSKCPIWSAPAADVAQVVHGRWVYNPNGMDWNLGAWQCSVCKCNNNNLPGNDKHNPYIFQGSNYCPNCGAKMDEEVNDK